MKDDYVKIETNQHPINEIINNEGIHNDEIN